VPAEHNWHIGEEVWTHIENNPPDFNQTRIREHQDVVVNYLNNNQPLYRRLNTRDDVITNLNAFFGGVISYLDQEEKHREDQMLRYALNESLLHYKTQEKKPNIILDMKSELFNEKMMENCTVCVSKYIKNDEVVNLDCKHVFHKKCISEWVKYKAECPVCRGKIKIIEKIKEDSEDEELVDESEDEEEEEEEEEDEDEEEEDDEEDEDIVEELELINEEEDEININRELNNYRDEYMNDENNSIGSGVEEVD